MDAEWIKSPTARRIVVHWADVRPAWLWSPDGATLLWRNAAARYFAARVKKSGLRLAAEATPIRGQVARLIRLGSLGRSSLSRVQFLAGGKPLAATCSCTPLGMPDGQVALLLVAVDPIPADVLETAGPLVDDAAVRGILPAGSDYLLADNGQAVRGSNAAMRGDGGEIDAVGLRAADAVELAANASTAVLFIYPSQGGASPANIEDVRAEDGIGPNDDVSGAADDDLAHTPEPMLPLGLDPMIEPMPAAPSDDWVEPLPEPPSDRPLSSLFDRLVEDAGLYTPLTSEDEVFAAPAPVEEMLPGEVESAPQPEETPPEPSLAPLPGEPDMIAAVIEYADDPEEAPTAASPVEPSPGLWMITGRGFRALEPRASASTEPPPIEPQLAEPPVASVDAATDAETAERVSRYNFEELGRILTDRVSGEPKSSAEPAAGPDNGPRAVAGPTGVINLNAETLVLNRLPLAILVFRDQQVLFANRALTDLLGHESVESLRGAGIASIFPNEESGSSGPVNRLIRRDGTALQVTARLQSVSWQGRAALMLSASTTEAPRGHEAAVRAFAEIAADTREEGFLVADRAGIVTHLSGHGAVLLGRPAPEVVGKPLAILVSRPDMDGLREFLEKPARFAETARPSLLASSEDGNTDVALFAEGQAGIVTGYFGFLRKKGHFGAAAPAPVSATPDDGIEPGMLGRLSRGIRRPLNTIIGFADLIRSAAFGSIDNERYVEYARDIRTAGLEIAVLADELDDFTRLRDGRYAPRPADVELSGLLESCMARVKQQAGAARVLVRSAISEQLPRVRADRASLGQALLNLLASAIDQTPVGGSVILSAQTDDEGNVAIHVRDGAENIVDPGDRFVVFRDGVDKDGEELGPVRSSVGLALTRSLLAVNACSLSVDPTVGTGTLFSLLIPAESVVKN